MKEDMINILKDKVPMNCFYECISYLPCLDITTKILMEQIYRMKAWNIYCKSNIYNIICSKKFKRRLWEMKEPYINEDNELYYEYVDIDCILVINIDKKYYVMTFW